MKTHLHQTHVCQLRWLPISALFLAAALLMPARIFANTAETQGTADPNGSSSLTGTANWTPATTISPTNVLATTFDYATATTLRTSANQNSYTVNANSLTLNSSSSLGFKGSNVITIPNLILNGGKIANSATSGNPDTGRLAGNINFTASSSLSPNASVNIYVSPAGNDANSGRVGEPVASLATAQKLARKFSRQEPVNVFLHGRTYYLPQTLICTSDDGGTSNAPVINGEQKLDLIWELNTNIAGVNFWTTMARHCFERR